MPYKIRRYVTVISRDIRVYCGRFVGPSHTVHGWSPCSKQRKKETIQRDPCDYKGHTHTRLPEGRHILGSEPEGWVRLVKAHGRSDMQSKVVGVGRWHHHVAGERQCVEVDKEKEWSLGDIH